jgi:4-amino-4-deoxy-L-arabinose transferase-like glycosyltransferase
MLERNDVIVPTFNGELRTHKPVLLYWLMMAGYRYFGATEWTARLPSALCSIGTIMCVWGCGRRLLGPRVGLLASVILATSVMFDVAARAATPDATLIFCMTAAITLFVLTSFPRHSRFETASPTEMTATETVFCTPFSAVARPWLSATGFYVALGAAMLAKGPVGFVLPMAIIGLFLLIVRCPVRVAFETNSGVSWSTARSWGVFVFRQLSAWFAPRHFLTTLWSMRPLTGMVIALVVAAPWYIAVGLATDGEWLRGFFLEHNLGRATRTMENHGGPFGLYYIVAVMIGFFPWSVWLVSALLDARRRGRAEGGMPPGVVLGICWIAVPILLFSCASTKLPSYVTPGYPGLALLVGHLLDRLLTGHAKIGLGWVRASCGSAVLAGLGIVIGGAVAVYGMFPGEYWLLVPGLVIAVGAALSLWYGSNLRWQRLLVSYVGGAVGFSVCLFQVAAPRVSAYQQFPEFVASTSSSKADIATFEVMRSSWVYYSNQNLKRFDRARIAELREFLQSDQPRFVVTSAVKLPVLSAELGTPLTPVREIPWFPKLKDQTLVLLKAEPVSNGVIPASAVVPAASAGPTSNPAASRR